MKRLWGILGSVGAILALAAAPALSRTYWVAPNGVYGAAGADTVSSPTTLTWFNANAQPGDVCRFKSGDYGTEEIAPLAVGTSTSRVRYYGFPQDPQGVRVANIQLGFHEGAYAGTRKGTYSTVRWVKTTSRFYGIGCWEGDMEMVQRDSIVGCIATSNGATRFGGQYHVIDTLTITGSLTTQAGDNRAFILFHGYYKATSTWCTDGPNGHSRDPALSIQFKNSTINFTKAGVAGESQVIKTNAADNLVFFNNTVNVTYSQAAINFWIVVENYNTRYASFQGNTFNIMMSVAPLSGTRGMFTNRDFSAHNRFFNNTVTQTGVGTIDVLRPGDGGSCVESVSENYFGFNTIKSEAPETAILYWQSAANSDTVEHNILATNSTLPAVDAIGTLFRGVVFSHNVFYSYGPTAFDLHRAAVPTGQNRLSNNVFYSDSLASTAAAPLVRFRQGIEADSAGLFFNTAGAATAAINNGTGAAAPSGTRNVWGTPTFVDSTYLTLDPRVTSVYATGSEWGDGYVGTGQNLGVPPTVSIAHPITANTDTVWNTYETMGVWWTATDNVSVSSITLEWMHPDEGLNEWSTIATGEANDGYYAWTLPTFKFSTAAVRVTAIDGDGLTTSATATFRCYAPEIPDRRPTVDDP